VPRARDRPAYASAPMDEIASDIDGWARAHGFTPIEWTPSGETPLLREGVLDIAADAYTGPVEGRDDAILSEYSVGSPGASEVIGGGGVDSSWYTMYLLVIADPGYRRLTIHPHALADRDWWNRLRGRDHRREIGDDEFDRSHQVIASSDLDEAGVADVIAPLRPILASLPDLLIEVESHDGVGSWLLVAHPGIGIGDERLDALHAACGRALAALDPAP
jgi:hypothetical protein